MADGSTVKRVQRTGCSEQHFEIYLKLRKLYRSESFLLELEFCFVVDPSASLLATACGGLFPNGIMLRLEFD